MKCRHENGIEKKNYSNNEKWLRWWSDVMKIVFKNHFCRFQEAWQHQSNYTALPRHRCQRFFRCWKSSVEEKASTSQLMVPHSTYQFIGFICHLYKCLCGNEKVFLFAFKPMFLALVRKRKWPFQLWFFVGRSVSLYDPIIVLPSFSPSSCCDVTVGEYWILFHFHESFCIEMFELHWHYRWSLSSLLK